MYGLQIRFTWKLVIWGAAAGTPWLLTVQLGSATLARCGRFVVEVPLAAVVTAVGAAASSDAGHEVAAAVVE
jgi:hypothetical protein